MRLNEITRAKITSCIDLLESIEEFELDMNQNSYLIGALEQLGYLMQLDTVELDRGESK